jgi:TusA-related sulfurtransferase
LSAQVLDERGRSCPLPIIALGRARRRWAPGTQITLLADDPVVLTDVPAWCAMVGAAVLQQHSDSGTFTYLIRL